MAGALIRGAVAVAARLTRNWWLKLNPARKEAIKSSLYRKRYLFYGTGAFSTLCVGGFYIHHIEKTPITGRRRFMLLSKNHLNELIEQEIANFDKEFTGNGVKLSTSDPRYKKVYYIVRQILTKNWSEDFEDQNWNLEVIESPNINALCLPGGRIYVFTGLLEACQNDHEIALILGHEIAHAVLGHGVENVNRQGVVGFISLFLVAVVWVFVHVDVVAFLTHKFAIGSTNVFLNLPYSRLLESEADNVGLTFAAKACYDPKLGIEVWSHFPDLQGSEVAYLNTHPSNQERLDTLQRLLPAAQELSEKSECKLSRDQFFTIVSKSIKKIVGTLKG